jgi:hypothetical protein
MIERFGRLPVPVRVGLAAAAMALFAAADLALVVRTSPWRADVLVAAALGALAAWPFRWRARSRAEKIALTSAIAVFAAVMVWARVTGRIASSFAFVFSVIVLSLPVQRARGRSDPPETPGGPPPA